MPELPKPTIGIVNAISTVKDKSSQDWTVSLSKHYDKQEKCRKDPNCVLIENK